MWVKSTENVTPSSDPKNHHKEVIFKCANVTAGEYKTVQNCSHGGATSRAAAAWRFADWVDALTAECRLLNWVKLLRLGRSDSECVFH